MARVAVVCTGGVGDILLTTPAIRAIKETFPQCRLTAIVHHKRMDMMKFNPHVDERLPLKKSLFYYLKIVHRLKADPPDVIFLFHTNDLYVYALASQGCPGNLIGYSSPNPLSFLLGKAIEFDDRLHIIENNLRMVSVIGAQTNDLTMNFLPGDDARVTANPFFHHAKYTVGFQLGSGFVGRRWPIAKYAELGQRLLEQLDVQILLLASPAEKPLANELHSALQEKTVPAVTDLLTAGEIISRLDVLVTPDTGPMHIAIALKCPTVALSGPTNPKNFGSLDGDSTKHIKIHKVASKEPYVKLSGDFSGLMDQISSDEVYEAVLSILGVERPPEARMSKENPSLL
ncbi:MAG: glycosyltransferase family 9 protein [Nitrospinota bacterium]|nr:glycosyltransferase family 9 protein [Nitrospinota bacterium]